MKKKTFTTTFLSSLRLNTFTKYKKNGKYKPRNAKYNVWNTKYLQQSPPCILKSSQNTKKTKYKKNWAQNTKWKKREITYLLPSHFSVIWIINPGWTKEGWDKRAVKQMCSVYHALYMDRNANFCKVWKWNSK